MSLSLTFEEDPLLVADGDDASLSSPQARIAELEARLCAANKIIADQQARIDLLSHQVLALSAGQAGGCSLASALDFQPAQPDVKAEEVPEANDGLSLPLDFEPAELAAPEGELQPVEPEVPQASPEAVSLNELDRAVLDQQVQRVQAFMDAQGFNQHSLAKLVGVSQGTLSCWLRGSYSGDVEAIGSKILAQLEAMEKGDLQRWRSLLDAPPAKEPKYEGSAKRRHNFSKEQIEIMESIARSLNRPYPGPDIVNDLGEKFGRPPQHILKWFSNWRSRKWPKVNNNNNNSRSAQQGGKGAAAAAAAAAARRSSVAPVPQVPQLVLNGNGTPLASPVAVPCSSMPAVMPACSLPPAASGMFQAAAGVMIPGFDLCVALQQQQQLQMQQLQAQESMQRSFAAFQDRRQ